MSIHSLLIQLMWEQVTALDYLLNTDGSPDGSLQPFEFSLLDNRLIIHHLGADLKREELLQKQAQSILDLLNLVIKGIPVKPFGIKKQVYYPGPTESFVKMLVLVDDDEPTDETDAEDAEDVETDVEDAETPSL